EIWICSDLRQSDWNAESGVWGLTRSAFQRMGRPVRVHLLAYPDAARDNLGIRVIRARRESADEVGTRPGQRGAHLVLDLHISRDEADAPSPAAEESFPPSNGGQAPEPDPSGY